MCFNSFVRLQIDPEIRKTQTHTHTYTFLCHTLNPDSDFRNLVKGLLGTRGMLLAALTSLCWGGWRGGGHCLCTCQSPSGLLPGCCGWPGPLTHLLLCWAVSEVGSHVPFADGGLWPGCGAGMWDEIGRWQEAVRSDSGSLESLPNSKRCHAPAQSM